MMSSNTVHNVSVLEDVVGEVDRNGEQPMNLSITANPSGVSVASVANADVLQENVEPGMSDTAAINRDGIAAQVAGNRESNMKDAAVDADADAEEGNGDDAAATGSATNAIAVAAVPTTQDVGTFTGPTGVTSRDAAISTNNEEEMAGAAAVASTSTSSSTATNEATSTTAAIDCPICLQTCIHPTRLPCGHIFCFLCVKGVAYKNRRCAMCRRPIPAEYLAYPQLVNGIEDIRTTKATEDGYQWFYEGRNGGWWAYDSRTAQLIEEAYRIRENILNNVNYVVDDDDVNDLFDEGYDTFATLICGTIYVVDFKEMVQYPQHRPSKARKINRAKHMPTVGWWRYDDGTSKDIEEAFQKGQKSCSILVAGFVYIVDLVTMSQQRQNDPTRVRRIKRDLATIHRKGVAGLYIEGNVVAADSMSSRYSSDSRSELHRSRSVLDLRMQAEFSFRRLGERNNLSDNVPGGIWNSVNITSAASNNIPRAMNSAPPANVIRVNRGISVIPFHNTAHEFLDAEHEEQQLSSENDNIGNPTAGGSPSMLDDPLMDDIDDIELEDSDSDSDSDDLWDAGDIWWDDPEWLMPNLHDNSSLLYD